MEQLRKSILLEALTKMHLSEKENLRMDWECNTPRRELESQTGKGCKAERLRENEMHNLQQLIEMFGSLCKPF